MARNFYIPEIGDAVTLAEDWTFPLHAEGRNTSLWEALGLPKLEHREYWFPNEEIPPKRREALEAAGVIIIARRDDSRYAYKRTWHEVAASVTLSKGTVLTVDRIYIRKGISEYSSVTFFVRETTIPHKKQLRFWAKLKDVNTMIVEDAVLPPLPKKSTKKKTCYHVWVKRTPEELAQIWVARDVAAYDRAITAGGYRRHSSFGPNWMNDPRYVSFGVNSVRSEDEFVKWIKKQYGDRLKYISYSGYDPSKKACIYEAP